nr:four helix bundle protein [Saprospiraceae bacterium]
MYSFEKLEVWQLSRELVKKIYQITTSFPSDEKFGLTNQLRRAAISVSSNIAEGSTRWSQKSKARFYEISFGSLIEILNQLIIAHDLGYLPKKDLAETRKLIDQTSRMLNALHQSTKNKPINQ